VASRTASAAIHAPSADACGSRRTRSSTVGGGCRSSCGAPSRASIGRRTALGPWTSTRCRRGGCPYSNGPRVPGLGGSVHRPTPRGSRSLPTSSLTTDLPVTGRGPNGLGSSMAAVARRGPGPPNAPSDTAEVVAVAEGNGRPAGSHESGRFARRTNASPNPLDIYQRGIVRGLRSVRDAAHCCHASGDRGGPPCRRRPTPVWRNE
jgi:hypothetical protein